MLPVVDVKAQNNVKIAGMIGREPAADPSPAMRELVVILASGWPRLSGCEFSYQKGGDGRGWSDLNHSVPFPLSCCHQALMSWPCSSSASWPNFSTQWNLPDFSGLNNHDRPLVKGLHFLLSCKFFQNSLHQGPMRPLIFDPII